MQRRRAATRRRTQKLVIHVNDTHLSSDCGIRVCTLCVTLFFLSLTLRAEMKGIQMNPPDEAISGEILNPGGQSKETPATCLLLLLINPDF